MPSYTEVERAYASFLYICNDCGAVVGDRERYKDTPSDREKHDTFHHVIGEIAKAAAKGSMAWSYQQPLGGFFDG